MTSDEFKTKAPFGDNYSNYSNFYATIINCLNQYSNTENDNIAKYNFLVILLSNLRCPQKNISASTSESISEASVSERINEASSDFPQDYSAVLNELIDSARHEMYGSLISSIDIYIKGATSITKPTLLSETIKEKFATDTNITTLIGKILAGNTDCVNDPSHPLYFEYTLHEFIDNSTPQKKGESLPLLPSVIDVFEQIKKSISETLEDIDHWMDVYSAKDITNILLTDSDMHSRGVGVCIVDYTIEDDEGLKTKKIVIKPEDKSFEKAVYGSGTASLAHDFNTALEQGLLGKDYKDAKIGQLNIETSTKNEHGSAMEFFPHQQYKDISDKNSINEKSVTSTIAFSSILGLADLHRENAVYSDDLNRLFQLIDAEIGFKYLLNDQNPLATAITQGEMNLNDNFTSLGSNYQFPTLVTNHKLLFDFIKKVEDKLKNEVVRIVPLPTPTFFSYRKSYLTEKWKVNANAEANEYKEKLTNKLYSFLSNFTANTYVFEDRLIELAEDDFKCGKIPFFTLQLNNGYLYQSDKKEEDRIVAYYIQPKPQNLLSSLIQDRICKLVPFYKRVFSS